MEILFHIAPPWGRCGARRPDRISTLDRTLEQEGFIHLSFAVSRGVDGRFYGGVR